MNFAKVYPRVCGGTIKGLESVDIAWGLSPRVRGNQHKKANQGMNWRSIPACAGEPLVGRVIRRARAVYPRVCGGTSI